MTLFYFLIVSLFFFVNDGCALYNFANELHKNSKSELLWVHRQSPSIDLMAKHRTRSTDTNTVKVYTGADGEINQERINELEQKLQDALIRMDDYYQKPRRSWFGCCKKRRRIEPSLNRQVPRPQPVVLHVHTHTPTTPTTNFTNINTNTFPPITNTNTVTCPPSCATVSSSSVSNSSPKQEYSTQEKEPPVPASSPSEKETESPSESSSADSIASPRPSSAESCTPPESTASVTIPPTENSESTIPETAPPSENKDENKEVEPNPLDSYEEKIQNTQFQTLVSTSEETLADFDFDDEGPSSPEKVSSEQKPSSITVFADIKLGEEEEPSKEQHPIYTSPRYSRSNKQSTKKNYPGFGLQMSVKNRNKKKTERPMHPIYTARSVGHMYGVRSAPEEDNLIRKVRLRKGRTSGSKPQATKEPDDLIRKVNLGKRKKLSSSESLSALTETRSDEGLGNFPIKPAKRRLALVAKYWPGVSEEDLYTKYQYIRPGHPQLEHDANYLTRQPHGKKVGANMNKITSKKISKKSPKKKNLKTKKP